MSFTLAIIGRPNVGKSTLFNRLVGRRLALVDDTPGVTRDLREGDARLFDLRFTVIDTAGLEEVTDDSLQGRMRRLTERAVEMADLSLFVIDGRAGVTPSDETFAEILRRKGARVVLAVNKAEGRAAEGGVIEGWSLGLGEPIAISAEHGEGMDDLYRALKPFEAEFAPREAEIAPVVDQDVSDAEDEPDPLAHRPTAAKPLQIAVIGRPNAGKSTLVNRILGQDRMLTGPEAGITRDAISVRADWLSTPLRIWDTAGMRKKARVVEKLEKLSVADGLRAVRFAEVVVVLLDAAIPFETQDLRIADYAETEGRAVVIAVNKWDLEDDKQEKLAELKEMFDRLLPQLRGAPLVTVSALTGRGMDRLHAAVTRAHDVWNRRVTTAKLNTWLQGATAAHPPPAPGGKRIKLRYATQVKTRPPGFVVMCSHPEELPDSYRRYLVNGLRDTFDLPGTPIRLTFRGKEGGNPYQKRMRTPSRLRKHLEKKGE
jgi:GTP-binding protein